MAITYHLTDNSSGVTTDKGVVPFLLARTADTGSIVASAPNGGFMSLDLCAPVGDPGAQTVTATSVTITLTFSSVDNDYTVRVVRIGVLSGTSFFGFSNPSGGASQTVASTVTFTLPNGTPSGTTYSSTDRFYVEFSFNNTQAHGGAGSCTLNVAGASITVDGISDGPAPASGSSSGSFSWTGTATGSATHEGFATGSVTFTGSSLGETEHRGSATGSTVWTGTADGSTVTSGTATGSFVFTGGASGTTPPLLQDGSASGAFSFAGSASGSISTAGSASGVLTWTGSSVGKTAHFGQATSSHAWTGNADGETVHEGQAPGAFVFVGSASGTAPTVASKSGSASGTFAFAGSATGEKVTRGSATGAYAFTGEASGPHQFPGLLPNGDFYDVPTINNASPDWNAWSVGTVRTDTNQLTVTTTDFVSSPRALKYHSVSDTFESPAFDVTPGTVYNVSFWIKSPFGSGTFFVSLKQWNASATAATDASIATPSVELTYVSGWGHYIVTFVATESTADRAVLFFNMSGISDFVLDDVIITIPSPGSASGFFSFDGQASGSVPYRGAAAGSFTWAGVVSGEMEPIGNASGSFVWVGEAAGGAFTAASGTYEWAGVATGTKPTILYFEPPTHEEPMRTDLKPLHYYRLTYSTTVFRRNGAFVSMRTPPAEWLTGEAGTDYFIGGHVYRVTPEIANELVAAGYNVREE